MPTCSRSGPPGRLALFFVGFVLTGSTCTVLQPHLEDTFSVEANTFLSGDANNPPMQSMSQLTSSLSEEFQAIYQMMAEIRRENDALWEENKRLNLKLNAVLEENRVTVEELEQRVEYLEAITRPIVPRTCQDLKNAGIAKSGPYMVDPDGSGIGDPPITVVCNMNDGSTTITHDMMEAVDVEHCPDPGCHSRSVEYSATDRQINALIELSTSCTQGIKYDCFATALSSGGVNYGWWTDSNGVDNFYWDGKHSPSEHVCTCASNSSCADPLLPCNCDAEAPTWMKDEGVLNDMAAALPVKELYFGGLAFDGQQARHTLGGLVCKGKKSFSATSSCQSLRDSGHSASGYFFLDDPSSGHYKMTYCDMTKANDDGGLQRDTQAKLASFPVAFDAYKRTGDFDTDGATFRFDGTQTNLGNGMLASTGKFVAPASGVYLFSFNFDDVTLPATSAGNTGVEIRRNGVAVGRTDAHNRDGVWGNLSESIVVQLAKGDVVECVMTSGLINSYGDDDHFIGALIFPL